MKKLFLFLLCVSISSLWAGESIVDSLLRVIPQTANTQKVDLIADLVYEYENLGNYSEAVRMGDWGLRLADSLGYAPGKGMLYNHLGAVYKARGDFQKALKYFQNAERILTEIRSERGLASLRLNLGNLYNSLGKKDKAEAYYLKSLEFGKKANDPRIMAVCYSNIGALKHMANKLNEAEYFYNLSLKLKESIGDSAGAATLYNNLGIVYFDKGDFKKAESYYQKYYNLAVQFGMKIDAVTGKLNLGEIYTYLGKFDEGIRILEEGLQDAVNLHARELEQAAYETLQIVWEQKENAGKALFYAEQLRNLKDSLLNEENAQTMAELETLFETEKKEQEINLLTKENTIRDLESKKADAELTRKNTLKYGSIAGVVLLFSLLFFFLKSSADQKKSNQLMEEKNKELEFQNTILEQKNALIHDSIEYAGIIQRTLFPSDEVLLKEFGGIRLERKPDQPIANYACAIERTNTSPVLFFVQSHLHGVSGSLHALRVYHELRNYCFTNLTFDPKKVMDYIRKHGSAQWKAVAAYKQSGSPELRLKGHQDLEDKLRTL
ncbi:MAG: tetratricopeptide repeat protein [Bacteroidia bacterium]|nr:tetratricopeptide repeat protein [Bacteroidia bacterium]